MRSIPELVFSVLTAMFYPIAISTAMRLLSWSIATDNGCFNPSSESPVKVFLKLASFLARGYGNDGEVSEASTVIAINTLPVTESIDHGSVTKVSLSAERTGI
jgi:hypothetical protein